MRQNRFPSCRRCPSRASLWPTTSHRFVITFGGAASRSGAAPRSALWRFCWFAAVSRSTFCARSETRIINELSFAVSYNTHNRKFRHWTWFALCIEFIGSDLEKSFQFLFLSRLFSDYFFKETIFKPASSFSGPVFSRPRPCCWVPRTLIIRSAFAVRFSARNWNRNDRKSA